MAVHLQLLRPDGNKPPVYTSIDVWGREIQRPNRGTFFSEESFVPTGTVAYQIQLPDSSIRRGWFFRVNGLASRQYRVEGVEFIGNRGSAVVLQGIENRDRLKLGLDVKIGNDFITIGGERIATG